MKDTNLGWPFHLQTNDLRLHTVVIEPIRAYDGLCGPPHKNATYLGTGRQYCNALGDAATLRKSLSIINTTFTYLHLIKYNLTLSPNIREDCAEGTCYEGACVGDAVYSTDGTCGRDHGFRSYTGI